ncbi:MAG: DUF4402 domain-containing protein [Planctomycetota bacterium]|jgi:hypothetical protein
MKTKRFYRIAGSCIVAFALILLAMSSIRAEEGTIPASVTITEALTVEGVNSLEYGVFTAPQSSLTNWIMSPVDGSLSQTGDISSTDLDPADHNRGSFRILGSPGMSVYYTVAVTTDFADPYLNLVVVGAYPSSPQLLDTNGELVLQIGAQLNIMPQVAEGVHNDAVITLVANY